MSQHIVILRDVFFDGYYFEDLDNPFVYPQGDGITYPTVGQAAEAAKAFYAVDNIDVAHSVQGDYNV